MSGSGGKDVGKDDLMARQTRRDIQRKYRSTDKFKKDEIKRNELMNERVAVISEQMVKNIEAEDDLSTRHGFLVNLDLVSKQSQPIKVYKATKMYCVDEDMVCKVIILDKCNLKLRANLTDESLKIMRFLGSGGEGGGARHQGFVTVFDMFSTNQKVYIFMNECQDMSLLSKINQKSNPIFGEHLYYVKKWAKQLAEAINYLHSSGISHNSLRAEHVGFNYSNDVKLAKLEKSSVYYSKSGIKMKPKVSESTKDEPKKDHLPPEAFQSDAYDPSLADVWGFGVVLCQMITKDNPFKVKAKESYEEMWRSFAQLHEFTNESKMLLDQIFVSDPKERIRIHEILSDRFFEN